ncbi:sodium-dependent transporter [Chungangia koreensis]|uniref:Sodium-dependent transporter n=1 Tax=Chungangia koreensis TaxID=752657 RepID=A0ABV8X7E9_9LACT
MKNRDQWQSKMGFVLAAAGSAIGLGAIWKFPYMAGTNGGSVFLLLFIISTLGIGLPILLAEFVIGRKGQRDAVSSIKRLAPGKQWQGIGWLGVMISLIILSFYSVVGGWIISYLVRSISMSFEGTGEDFYNRLFETVISNPFEALIGQAIFLLLTIWIVSGGIKGGIERANKWMMPLLFIFFIILAVRSITLDGAIEGLKFLFVPDWSYLTWSTALSALGQAFFTLSVGSAAMMTYASYLSAEQKLGQSALSVSLMNIVISILAGIVIFPAVFSLGFSPNEGPGLVFIILPAVFDQIVFGSFFLIIFFILLLFATLTSSMSMLEIAVAIGIREKYENRKKAAWLIGLITFVIGIPSALSFGILSDVSIAGYSIFDFADMITSKIGMPIGAFLVAIFAGYVLKKQDLQNELNPQVLATWRILIRYIVPIAIAFIFIQGLASL